MNCEAVLVGCRIAFEANQHGALAVAENGLGCAASVEGVGVDAHAYSEVHGRQCIVERGYVLHGLDGLEYLHALQGWCAVLCSA